MAGCSNAGKYVYRGMIFYKERNICRIQQETYPRTNTVNETGERLYVQSLQSEELGWLARRIDGLKLVFQNIMPIFAIPHMNIPQLRVFDASLEIGDEYPHGFFMRDYEQVLILLRF